MPPKHCNFNIVSDDSHWTGRKRAHTAKQNVYNVKRKRRAGTNTAAPVVNRVAATYRRFRKKQCAPKRNQNFVSCHTRKGGAIKVKAYCRKNPGT